MRTIATPTFTMLEIAGGAELASALERLDPLALGLFDRDIAYEGEIPSGLLRVHINHDRPLTVRSPGVATYIAGWLYVCNMSFLYRLEITPGSKEGGRWIKTIFGEPKKRSA